MHDVTGSEATRWLDAPVQLDRGKFWGLAFARSGERLAYVSHDLGFCQLLETDLDGNARRTILSLGEDEVVSEVHGWSADDRFLVFTASARGRREVRVVEVSTRVPYARVREAFFGGFDDANDAFFVWDRATGARRVMRVSFAGATAPVDAGHMDRRITRSEDGHVVYFAQKFSDDPADRRFTIYGAGDSGAPTAVAMIATTCRTSRLTLTLSPGGCYLHVAAVGPVEPGGDPVSFDLVLATDGSHRRSLPLKGWVYRERALVGGRARSLDVVDVRSGARRPLVPESVDQFAVNREGTRVAFTSAGALRHVAVS